MALEGKYLGRIKEYGLKETRKGEPRVVAIFTVTDNEGRSHNVFWSGMLSNEKSIKITIAALVKLGLSSAYDLPLIALGSAEGPLNLHKTVELDIIQEAHQDDETKFSPKVQWINLPGGKAMEGNVSVGRAQVLLSGLSVKELIDAEVKKQGGSEPDAFPNFEGLPS